MRSDEILDYRMEKRRREMEESRQKRIRAFEEEEAKDRDPNDPAGWGGSDEEVRTILLHATRRSLETHLR